MRRMRDPDLGVALFGAWRIDLRAGIRSGAVRNRLRGRESRSFRGGNAGTQTGPKIKSQSPRKSVCVCGLCLCGLVRWNLLKLRRPLIDPEIEKSPQSQNAPQGQPEPEQTARSRQIQRRMDARLQMAEAQKTLARAMEKNARYMLLSTIIAGLTTILAVATIVFEVFVGFPRPPH